ncbi:MAG: sulfate ABC transporter permease subunit CysT [Verrucomicrobia bacterium]|nr:sulfate ABC transporter permease subunit CysT [Verrucomicrobiota bacterium]MBV8482513.1 sulfate ABC transporter permease subunit CysT [Verrucomicrobiota bacterium]
MTNSVPFSLWWRRQILPGFGLSLGFTLVYLSLIVLIPLAALFIKASGIGFDGFIRTILSPRVLAAFQLSFSVSFYAALVNTFLGTILAWVLVRYRFPGRRFLDAIVDFPFALPTAVAGIALTAIYSPNGWIGAPVHALTGWKLTFTPLGIFLALVFIGFPFVVRTVQPVLADLNIEFEEAAASLGASRLQTIFRIVIPELIPAALTGFTLAFARALGEYGSVVFISGNMPMKTEIVPLLIMMELDQFHYIEATVIAAVMLVVSLILLFLINGLQRWGKLTGELA